MNITLFLMGIIIVVPTVVAIILCMVFKEEVKEPERKFRYDTCYRKKPSKKSPKTVSSTTAMTGLAQALCAGLRQAQATRLATAQPARQAPARPATRPATANSVKRVSPAGIAQKPSTTTVVEEFEAISW
jgi:hypothetical protein